jgi:hypothetical protein
MEKGQEGKRVIVIIIFPSSSLGAIFITKLFEGQA